jgi:hypothetical protein
MQFSKNYLCLVSIMCFSILQLTAKRNVLEHMIVTQLVRMYRLPKMEDELAGSQEADSGLVHCHVLFI